jgi:hypothetical protein
MKQHIHQIFGCALVCALIIPSAAARSWSTRSVARQSVFRGGKADGNRTNRNGNVSRNAGIDTDRDGRGCCYHTPAATDEVDVVAPPPSAVPAGSVSYSLPPACSIVLVGGIAYQQCGDTWYQPQLAGGSMSYVVVNPPR